MDSPPRPHRLRGPMLLAAVSFSAVVTSMTPGFGSDDRLEEVKRTVAVSHYEARSNTLSGGLLAETASCRARERVHILEDLGEPVGFSVVARTRTDRRGEWSVSYSAHPGDHLRVDVPESFGRAGDCGQASSKVYEVD